MERPTSRSVQRGGDQRRTKLLPRGATLPREFSRTPRSPTSKLQASSPSFKMSPQSIRHLVSAGHPDKGCRLIGEFFIYLRLCLFGTSANTGFLGTIPLVTPLLWRRLLCLALESGNLIPPPERRVLATSLLYVPSTLVVSSSYDDCGFHSSCHMQYKPLFLGSFFSRFSPAATRFGFGEMNIPVAHHRDQPTPPPVRAQVRRWPVTRPSLPSPPDSSF